MIAFEQVPAFVTRGMCCLYRKDGHWTVTGGTAESNLRDCLATLWWLHGADVKTEVKVPNCGRIDIMLTLGRFTEVIELKRSISTPSEAVAAYRQAHSYVAFLEADYDHTASPNERFDYENRRRFHGTVLGLDFEPLAVETAERAYSSIDGHPYRNGMGHAVMGRPQPFGPVECAVDPVVAQRRHWQISRLVSFLDLARCDLLAESVEADLALVVLP